MDFAGEVALITGAGRGIGRAVAEKLAAGQAAVLAADVDLAGAEDVALAVLGGGGLARALKMDVRSPRDWSRAIKAALAWKGGLHILVNNAGFDRPGTVEAVSLKDWQAVLEVHLTACLLGIKAVTPVFKKQGRGRIVNLASMYAKTGGQGEAAYTAAKAGLVGLTKSAAQELGRYDILVNCVLPGLTDTPAIQKLMSEKVKEKILKQTPLRRMAQPAEIASVIAFLCSKEASFVTGAAWEVSGGWNM